MTWKPWAIGAGLLLCACAARAQVDVWIDTDPSIGMAFRDADDGFALIQAFRSPELRIRGISATYGNASVEQTSEITRNLAQWFGASAGLDERRVLDGATGADALGQPTTATEALAAALGERRLTYLALGPLTDLATFIKCYPQLVERIDRVIFLGGRAPGERFHLGTRLSYEFHDANFEKDPLALLTVLRASVPLELVPMSTAKSVLFTPDDLERLGREGGAAGAYLQNNTKSWLRSWRWLFGLEGGLAFDSLAVLAVTHPEEFIDREAEVRVSDNRDFPHPPALDDAGCPLFLLLMDPRPDPGTRKVLVHSQAKPGAKKKILNALLHRGAPLLQ